MGLKDKLKKKKSEDKEKPEEIGGILEDAVIPGRLSDAPPAVENIPEIPEPSEVPFAGGFPESADDSEEDAAAPPPKDDDLSALDIFAAETAEEEEDSRLADQLPDIDIHDLLMECREIYEIFKQNTE